MKTQKVLNIVFSIIILLLTFILLCDFEKEEKQEKTISKKGNISKNYSLLEINSTPAIQLNGVILPSSIEEAKMNVFSKIDTKAPSINKGEYFRKGDVLLKAERLEKLYTLLKTKESFKKELRIVTESIKKLPTPRTNDWKQYLVHYEKSGNLTTLPKVNKPQVDSIVKSSQVTALFYTIKEIERKLQDYYYIAPFSGYVMENNTKSNPDIFPEKALLHLVKEKSYYFSTQIEAQYLHLLNEDDTLNLINQQSETIATVRLSKVGSFKNDSTIVKLKYNIISTDLKTLDLLNQIAFIEVSKNEKKIPNTAIKNDTVKVYTRNYELFSLPVEVLSTTKDSTIVKGLPANCWLVTQ